MALNVKEVIKELGDTNWSKDNDSQGKAIQLLKGLAFSDEKLANDFMEALDKASTGIAKKLLGDSDDKPLEEQRDAFTDQMDNLL